MYEYKCDACGHTFERYSAGKSAGSEGIECAQCGKGRAKKVFSTFASNCFGNGGVVSSSAGGCSSGGCGGGSSSFS